MIGKTLANQLRAQVVGTVVSISTTVKPLSWRLRALQEEGTGEATLSRTQMIVRGTILGSKYDGVNSIRGDTRRHAKVSTPIIQHLPTRGVRIFDSRYAPSL
jgi:hypothetical protein